MREAEPGSSGALILGAMRVLDGAVKPEERAEYTASLQRILHMSAQEASMIRLGTGKPFDPAVIAAVQASLVRLDAAPAAERASWWDRLRKKQ